MRRLGLSRRNPSIDLACSGTGNCSVKSPTDDGFFFLSAVSFDMAHYAYSKLAWAAESRDANNSRGTGEPDSIYLKGDKTVKEL